MHTRSCPSPGAGRRPTCYFGNRCPIGEGARNEGERLAEEAAGLYFDDESSSGRRADREQVVEAGSVGERDQEAGIGTC